MGGLEQAIVANPRLIGLLERAALLDLRDWYVGAGAIAQTVWNQLHGFDSTCGIKDYDRVYFDPDDLRRKASLPSKHAPPTPQRTSE